MLDGTISTAAADNLISTLDSQFRLNFKDLIKQAKLNTHKCQYMCYTNKKELIDAEECARNCFKPLLYAKKNISTLIEIKKEEFEKCRFASESRNKENSLNAVEIKKCISKYQNDLNGLKDEIDYIYNGYMKNYDTLLAEFENTEKKI
jgi:hypothetical protein